MSGSWLFLAAYACSGLAGLVYEVSWTRLATLYMGHHHCSSQHGVAAFMGGLAGGSAIGGALAPRLTRRQALGATSRSKHGRPGRPGVAVGVVALTPLLKWAYAKALQPCSSPRSDSCRARLFTSGVSADNSHGNTRATRTTCLERDVGTERLPASQPGARRRRLRTLQPASHERCDHRAGCCSGVSHVQRRQSCPAHFVNQAASPEQAYAPETANFPLIKMQSIRTVLSETRSGTSPIFLIATRLGGCKLALGAWPHSEVSSRSHTTCEG